MEKLFTFRNIISSIVCVFIIQSCGQSPHDKMEKGISLYNNGNTEKGKLYMEDGLINSALIEKLSEKQISYGDNTIFIRKKNILQIIYPVELDIKIDDKYNLLSYDAESKKLGVSNGIEIKIYDSDGTLIKTFTSAADEQRVKAFTIINDKVYYVKDRKIYLYDLASDSTTPLTNDKLKVSSENDVYNVKFFKTESSLGIAAGIGGNYYFNILDLKNTKMTLTDLSVASSKLLFQSNEIIFIAGDASKYSLVKFTMPSKTKNTLLELKDLTDIELFPSGALAEDKDGPGIIEYGNAFNQKIPFRYKLSGQCGGSPVIKYNNAYYIINMASFINNITDLKNKIPAAFEEPAKK